MTTFSISTARIFFWIQNITGALDTNERLDITADPILDLLQVCDIWLFLLRETSNLLSINSGWGVIPNTA